MRFKPILLALLACQYAHSVKAETTPVKIETFVVKPGLCIVERGQVCRQSFSFDWRLNQVANACLYQAKQIQPLRCIADKQQEGLKLLLELEHSKQFKLKVADLEAQQSIQVRELGKDVRQSRRHLWSVF